jgi:peptidylprolyl isomerase domain and WD repeat-containing protein 1
MIVLNLETQETVCYCGKLENARFLHVGLFQGITNKPKAIITLEMRASNNPNLQIVKQDPTIFATAYKKNRFYLFTKREPEDTKKFVFFFFYQNLAFIYSLWKAHLIYRYSSADNERDVFNEKPTKEEIVAATEVLISY